MPRSLPLLTDLMPPLDGRPLDRREFNELRAVRLALAMLTTVFQAQEFLPRHRPIPGGHDADTVWLFTHLEPLAQVSTTVRRLRLLFDQRRYGREWYSPTRVRRNLKRLANAAILLSQVMEAEAGHALPRRRRGR